MPSSALASSARTLRRALIEALWAQWSGIEAWPAGKPARSIVDPEALVLASLWLEGEEPRFWRLLRSWAAGGARYLSVQRMKNLAPHYPGRARDRLADFSWECAERGGDARWRSLARAPTRAVRKRMRELEPSPRFQTPSALLLRLRIGLGVGIKADVLAFLLGSAGGSRTMREITQATGYFRRAVARGVEELATAGFVLARTTAPASYRALPQQWDALLNLGSSPPIWWYWDALFRFAGALDQAATEAADRTPFLQASLARDLMEGHAGAFELNAVRARPLTSASGERYLQVFAEDVAELAERARRQMV